MMMKIAERESKRAFVVLVDGGGGGGGGGGRQECSRNDHRR